MSWWPAPPAREADHGGPWPQVTVLLLVTHPPEPLAELYAEFSAPLREGGWPLEFVVLCEASYAGEVEPLRALADRGEPVRVLTAGERLGESALLRVGAEYARGEVVLTLPSVRRVEAAALPELVRGIEAGADLVSACRWPRRDSLVNRWQTRAIDWFLGRLTESPIRDMGCGVRAVRREVLRELPLHGEGHRFLPLLALREGYQVAEVEAPQHPAQRGVRVSSPWYYVRRLVDLLGLYFLMRFTGKPLRFFGIIGSALSVVGAAILLLLFIQKLGGRGIADRPLLVLGVLIFTLGVQAFALGLVGEIIVHLHAPRQRPYRVREASTAAHGGREDGGGGESQTPVSAVAEPRRRGE